MQISQHDYESITVRSFARFIQRTERLFSACEKRSVLTIYHVLSLLSDIGGYVNVETRTGIGIDCFNSVGLKGEWLEVRRHSPAEEYDRGESSHQIIRVKPAMLAVCQADEPEYNALVLINNVQGHQTVGIDELLSAEDDVDVELEMTRQGVCEVLRIGSRMTPLMFYPKGGAFRDAQERSYFIDELLLKL